jgi:hypothetical protein
MGRSDVRRREKAEVLDSGSIIDTVAESQLDGSRYSEKANKAASEVRA